MTIMIGLSKLIIYVFTLFEIVSFFALIGTFEIKLLVALPFTAQNDNFWNGWPYGSGYTYTTQKLCSIFSSKNTRYIMTCCFGNNLYRTVTQGASHIIG